ncbi:hypothetical protein H257_03174 [Aphanomyces astaci]|uniref:Uncharacterized protein n=1 Tax=Aphanomyces astaci TaxID=112090 RepID=W4H0A5_APHAT|nr:hypothetical protein H257_03174 [Aphanomyces astaci]ETV85435.1 hypothetical protein H257_03174 [Aphanomyces astaci]|eukprot:XP_009825453.1 hypothetical protein H257_03174 [Aphanomyces astaci]
MSRTPSRSHCCNLASCAWMRWPTVASSDSASATMNDDKSTSPCNARHLVSMRLASRYFCHTSVQVCAHASVLGLLYTGRGGLSSFFRVGCFADPPRPSSDSAFRFLPWDVSISFLDIAPSVASLGYFLTKLFSSADRCSGFRRVLSAHSSFE